jgi:hypothetical protein
MNFKFAVLFGLLLLVFAGQTFITHATTPTPTPAPSKTATLTPPPSSTPAAVTPEPTAEPTALAQPGEMMEPFTQSDLNVLTGNVQRPNGIYWFNDELYVGCNGDWTLYQINSVTGATLTYIYGVRNVHTLHAESDTAGEVNLYVPDYERNVLLRVRRTGLQTVASNLSGPWGITPYDADSFLVTNLLSGNIVRITRTGNVAEFLGDLRSPTGVVVDGEYVYVANNGSARRAVEWTTADSTTNTGSTPQPLISGLQNPTGLVLASDGFLYVAYSLGTRGVVGRVNPQVCRENGGCTNDQVEIVLYSELAAPLAGLAISPDMRLFVHTIYRPEIYWVQLNGDPQS